MGITKRKNTEDKTNYIEDREKTHKPGDTGERKLKQNSTKS